MKVFVGLPAATPADFRQVLVSLISNLLGVFRLGDNHSIWSAIILAVDT